MSDKTGIKLVRFLTQKLKGVFLPKDILSFLLFLALSAVFWFVHALGKERETVVTVPVVYAGVPLNVAVEKGLPSEIKLTLSDQGLRLLKYSQHIQPLSFDLSEKFHSGKIVRVSSSELSHKLQRTLGLLPSTTITDIRPDSLLIKYHRLTSRRLPVRLVGNLETAPQYMLSRNVHISPGYVTVYGDQAVLDTMKCVYTQPLVMQELTDTVRTVVRLHDDTHIHYSSNSVKVLIFVEPFTEKKIQFPVTSLNCPTDLSIKSFPAYVQVTYTVGLSYFNKLDLDDILVYLDYNDLIDNKTGRQMLRVKNNSTHINNVRISPQEVEFILEHR